MRKSFCLQSLHFRHTWSKEGRWDEPAQPVNGAASAHALFPYKIVVVFNEKAGCHVYRDLGSSKEDLSKQTSPHKNSS